MKQKVTSKLTGRILKNLIALVSLITVFAFTATAQNYPFPQNYEYPYGEIYTGSDTEAKIQGLYSAWKATYYREGTIKGKDCARIRFFQPGETGDATVSEGIAYGMLIFVYMDNKTNDTQDEFDRLWNYYVANADHQGFMNWKVNAFTGNVWTGQGNEHGATDADVDVANTLLMAHKQWGSDGDIDYLTEAKNLINSIYTYEVDGNKLLKPGNAFNDYANPCYYITNSTELFGRVEEAEGWQSSDRWKAVTNACYGMMFDSRNSSTGLVPDWCHNGVNGTWAAPINGIVNDKFESYFLYDAVRIPWRMAHAYAWYGHTEAYDLANDITTWVKGKYSNPGDIKDGYFLDGDVFSSAEANFSTLGKSSNPCFSGGLSIGAMVNPANSAYMDKCWNIGSQTDGYGAYYTHTTQLLYMMTLTGNMPNFWDMKPTPVAAETNSNGDVIYVEFSKDLYSTASKVGWTVETYADEFDKSATDVSVYSISVKDKKVTVTLSKDIAEPVIKISYNGTSIKSSADDLKADAFEDFVVTNKITNMEPYPVLRFTNTIGTQIKIQWSKEIDPASLEASDFSLTVDGANVPITGIEVDADNETIVNLLIDGGSIASADDEILLSFDGGSISGTSSSKTALAFADKEVQNFYLSVDCYSISDFDIPNLPLVPGWDGAVKWDAAAADPDNATNKVAKFEGTGATWGAVRAAFTDPTDFMAAMKQDGATFKCRIYLIEDPLEHGIEIHLMHSDLYDWDGTGRVIKIPTSDLKQGEWVEIESDFSSPADDKYDAVMIRSANSENKEDCGQQSVTNMKFYIDDISLCPPPPTVNFKSGVVSYDGTKVEVRFSTAMAVPESTEALTIKSSDHGILTVSSVEAKQGDATVLVFNLETPVLEATEAITVTASSGDLTAADGRTNESFYKEPLANLFGITVTTGWRDDFATTEDYVTENIGIGDDFIGEEDPDGDGVYSVTMDGSDGYKGVSVMTYVNSAQASKEVMDLTGREVVEFRYRIKGSVPANLEFRIDAADLVNCYNDAISGADYMSDGMSWTKLTPKTTWQTVTVNIGPTLFNQYTSGGMGDIDRTNIYQVMMYFIEAQGTDANNYEPTVFDGTIEFDYISIGTPLYLYDVTPEVDEGSTAEVNATGTADGTIYIVPEETDPVLAALQDAVFDGEGVSKDVTANAAATISIADIKAGYYKAYLYDPSAGAISAGVGINIVDVTAPIILEATDGDVALSGTVAVTVNEDAMVYVVPVGADVSTTSKIMSASLYSTAVAADISTVISLEKIKTLSVDDEIKFIAVDYGTPSKNISELSEETVIIVDEDLAMTVTPTGEVGQGDPITVEVNRPATAYLVPATILVEGQDDLKSAVATAAVTGELSTEGVEEGSYFVWVSDGKDIIGPSARITVKILIQPVTAITLLPSEVTVDKDATETVEVVFEPSSNVYKSLDFDFDDKVVDVEYDSTTNVISITGVDVTNGTDTEIKVTSVPDGVEETITVNVTCPTAAPTALEVPDVETCADSPVDLVATFSGSETAVWYADKDATTALETGNTFEHGKTEAGLYTFFVAKNDGCESEDRLEVSLKISKNPTPTIDGLDDAYCISDNTAYTLEGTPATGTFTIDGTAATKFNPSTLTEGAHTVEYTVAVGGCSGTVSQEVEIEKPSTINLAGNPTEMCSGDAAVELSAIPANGTWSGDGISGTEFNPADASTGDNVLTYELVEGSCTTTEDITIEVFATPNPTFSALPAAVCLGSAAIDLTTAVNVSGGTFSDDKGNVVGDELVPTVAGETIIEYEVTKGSCTGTVQTTIEVNALPELTLTAVGSLCTNGGVETLVATPTGGTWSGSTAISGNEFDPSKVSAGDYDINYTYTDAKTSCEATETISIEVNTAANPEVSDVTVQVGSEIPELTAKGTEIKWYESEDDATAVETGSSYTPTGISTATENEEFTYYVSNTENGCESAKVPVTITVSSCLVEAPTNPSVEKVCFGEENPELTATFLSTATDYVWYDAAGTELGRGKTFKPTETIVGSHTYKVSQVDVCEGAKATVTLKIESKPEVLVIVSDEICEGTTAGSLSTTAASGATIAWYDENQDAIVGEDSETFSPSETAADSYTYYATQTVGNCTSDFAEGTYNIIAKPAAPVIATAKACLGDDYSISATGSNIKWYSDVAGSNQIETGATLEPTDVTVADTYTYYATQTIGTCVSDVASGELTVNALPEVTITGATELCSNNGVETFVGSPVGGAFSGPGIDAVTGEFTPDASLFGENTLIYTYTDANSCSAKAQAIINVGHADLPTVTGASCLIGESVPELSANASGTATWYENEDDASSVATGATFTPSVSTATEKEFTFYVSNKVGDCESASVPVKLTVSGCATVAPITTSAEICLGDKVVALTAEGENIEWYDAEGNNVGSGESFEPTDTDADTYTYYATQNDGCESPKAEAKFTINALPTVSFDAIGDLCFSDAPVTLKDFVTPSTGSFSGNGVSAGKLTPSEAIAGDVTVTYSYTDATTNCVAKAVQDVTINFTAKPEITNTPVIASIGVTPAPFEAEGTNIKWYSDAALTASIGSGTECQVSASPVKGNTTFYATQEENNCVSEAAEAVRSVTDCSTPLPKVTGAESCEDETIEELTAVGTDLKWYSDAELTTSVATGETFTPDVTDAASYTYYVTQTIDCEGSAAQVIYTVKPLPVVSFEAPASSFCNDDDEVFDMTTLVSPKGGSFSGSITTSTFVPSDQGIGGSNVTYTFTNTTTACSNSADQTINIINCGAPLTTDITISTSIEVDENETKAIKVGVEPTGASTVVNWIIDDETIVSIDSDGNITGLAAGTTTIKAVATDGSLIESSVCTITVNEVYEDVADVEFDASLVPDEMIEGESFDFSDLVVTDPVDVELESVEFSSTDSYVTVNPETGIVTVNDGLKVEKDVTIIVTVIDKNGNKKSATVTITVKPAPVMVSGIKITRTLTLEEGSTHIMASATVTPSIADDLSYTWSIASGTGADIDPITGEITVTGSAGDEFTVIATANDADAVESNECVVSIVEEVIPVTSISVDVTTVEVEAGESAIIEVTFNPSDATQTDLTFNVGTSGVVEYEKLSDTKYKVTGLKGGSQNVVVKSNDNTSVYTSFAVNVTEKVSSIVVSATDGKTSVNINETLQLSAAPQPATATDKTVRWVSSDPSIATVDENGKVTAVSTGYVTISAIANDGSRTEGTYDLEVVKVDVISINVNGDIVLELGESQKISYTINPTSASNKAVTFVSADPSKVTVNEEGLVTAVALDSISPIVTITIRSLDNPNIIEELTVTVIAKQANKAALDGLVEQAWVVYDKVFPEDGGEPEIEIGYSEGEVDPITWNKFLDAWAKAQDVLYDGNATQEEVNDAHDELYEAITAMGHTIPSTGVEDVEEAEIVVYPTMISSTLTVSAENIELVKIVNSNGAVVEVLNGDGANEVQVNTSYYAQGVYYVTVKTQKQLVVKKVIK